jgi:hypothetical protein
MSRVRRCDVRVRLAGSVLRALVIVAILALCVATGYLVGSWHASFVTAAEARLVIEDFASQMSVLEGRVIALSDVCR